MEWSVDSSSAIKSTLFEEVHEISWTIHPANRLQSSVDMNTTPEPMTLTFQNSQRG